MVAVASPAAACEPAGAVLLNELEVDPPGADAGREWVELFNPTMIPMALDAWVVERATNLGAANPWGVVFDVPDDTWIDPFDWLVLAGPLAEVPDGPKVLRLPQQHDMGNALGGAHACVRLLDCTADPSDALGYGAAGVTGLACPDRDGLPIGSDRLVQRPAANSDASFGRLPDGHDSGQPRDDFAILPVPTPAASNTTQPAPVDPDPVEPDPPVDPDPVQPEPPEPDEPDGCDLEPEAAVLLNELEYDPPGPDAQAEWVELKNVGPSSVDLSGWRVERANAAGATNASGWRAVWTLPEGIVLAAGDWLVLAGTDAAISAPSLRMSAGTELGNATSRPNAARLVDCADQVRDVVVWGDTYGSSPRFDDALGDPIDDDRLAPRLPANVERSLGRIPDGVDTLDGALDFASTLYTPGAENEPEESTDEGGGDPAALCAAGDAPAVVLNELEYDPPGADANAEWVELRNNSGAAVDLGGWRVERANAADATGAASWRSVFAVPEGVVLSPAQHLVLAGELADLPLGAALLLAQGTELGNATSRPNAARLVGSGCVVDVVVWGDAYADGARFTDESGAAIDSDRLAPRVPANDGDRTLSRLPDGVDTDHGADFGVGLATPGAPNEAAPSDGGTTYEGPCAPGSPGQVVINEAMPNPGRVASNGETARDEGYEWLELFNPTDAPVALGGWRVHQAGTPADWDAVSRRRLVFDAEQVLAPGAYLLVADALVPTSPGVRDALDALDVVLLPEGQSLRLGNSEAAVRLEDCAGAPIDTLVYGAANTRGWHGDAPSPLLDAELAPVPPEDHSLARRSDGVDTDDCGQDFVVEAQPTPGRPNPDLSCRALAGSVVINELMPVARGRDTEVMRDWVELFNTSQEPVDITTWTLWTATQLGDDGTPAARRLYSFPPGSVVPASGFLTVGWLLAERVDLYADPFDLPSGLRVDALWLEDCAGGRADGVLWGGENEDALPEDDGVVPEHGAPRSRDDQCVARKRDGVDTDRSLDDFRLTARCTPGAPNVQEGDDALFTRAGCAGRAAPGGPRQASAPQADSGACSTGGGGPVWPALLLGLLGRRRLRRR